MDIKFMLEILVTVGGWCVMLGIYLSKIKQHDADIIDLKKKSDDTTKLLNSINEQLVELNTKMSLLIGGQLKPGVEKKS